MEKIKEKIKKGFRKENLVILILIGVLLMVIAMPSDRQEEDSDQRPGEKTEGQEKGIFLKDGEEKEYPENSQQESELGFGVHETEEYTAYLEERLTQLLSGIDGIGKVRVMITLQSSEELVLEKDMPIIRSNTTESDAEGGSRSVYQVDSRENTVYTTEENVQAPFVIKTLAPRIEGVVVTAQGAGTARISADIAEAVQALFGIEAHKVKVIRMASE